MVTDRLGASCVVELVLAREIDVVVEIKVRKLIVVSELAV